MLITPTVHGNVLVGPDSNFVGEKDDVSTEAMSLEDIRCVAIKSSDKIPFHQVIRTFAGLRASSTTGDFIIGESQVAKGFVHVGGFESPGLSAAPAVATYVANLIGETLLKVRRILSLSLDDVRLFDLQSYRFRINKNM